MKKLLSIIVVISLLLTACASSNDKTSQEAPAQSTPKPTALVPSGAMGDETITDPWETMGKFEPQEAVTTTVETYKICEGKPFENEITVLTAKEKGPTIFLLAGMHGDEIAGWTAINNLKNMELKKGKVYILSPANITGANADPRVRYVSEKNDLNRSFPGNPDGNDAEVLADAITKEILKMKPVIILDHHEARVVKENRDFLGSSLIYTTLNGIDELFLDMHQATQDRKLCAEPFKFFGPGPVGSMNNYLGTTYDLPVITVETYRAYPLQRRVEEHMAIAGYVLSYYGMV